MRGNPLKAFIDDDLFSMLWDKGFLNERAIRDHYIREKFAQMKETEKPKEIIQALQQEFPYLSVDTVRKIVYTRNDDFPPLGYDGESIFQA